MPSSAAMKAEASSARSSSMAYPAEANRLSISRFKRLAWPVQWLNSWRPLAAYSGAPEKALSGGSWMWSVAVNRRPVAACADYGPAVLQDAVCRLGPGPGRFLNTRCHVLGEHPKPASRDHLK